MIARIGWVFLLAAFACAVPAGDPGTPRAGDAAGPYLLVLGTAQDGGLPHAGCACARCEAARGDPARRRNVASLAIVLADAARVYLIDVTPDIRVQLDMLRSATGVAPGAFDRSPLDGVLLTHAHIGHYLGLAFFGFEAMHSTKLPLYGTASMVEFLRSNGPWDQLIRLDNVVPHVIEPGVAIGLGGGVTVTPIAVPHRREYSDTVGYLVAGPRNRVLYLPDSDPWHAWQTPIDEIVRSADVAIVDGTFYSADELPGRDLGRIGHPPIVDSLARFGSLVASGEVDVRFTHLNHTNPALEPRGQVRAEIEGRGFRVLADGERIPL